MLITITCYLEKTTSEGKISFVGGWGGGGGVNNLFYASCFRKKIISYKDIKIDPGGPRARNLTRGLIFVELGWYNF